MYRYSANSKYILRFCGFTTGEWSVNATANITTIAPKADYLTFVVISVVVGVLLTTMLVIIALVVRCKQRSKRYEQAPAGASTTNTTPTARFERQDSTIPGYETITIAERFVMRKTDVCSVHVHEQSFVKHLYGFL